MELNTLVTDLLPLKSSCLVRSDYQMRDTFSGDTWKMTSLFQSARRKLRRLCFFVIGKRARIQAMLNPICAQGQTGFSDYHQTRPMSGHFAQFNGGLERKPWMRQHRHQTQSYRVKNMPEWLLHASGPQINIISSLKRTLRSFFS